MASAMVEIMPLSEHALAKVDDSHMSVDELCMSVKSISLTETSVQKVVQQTVNDTETTFAKNHVADFTDEHERIKTDKQPAELDGQSAMISGGNQSKEALMSCSEKVDEETEKDEDSRQGNEEYEDELSSISAELSLISVEDGDRTGSTKQKGNGTGSYGFHQCIPQEHDETTNEVIAITQEATAPAAGLTPHGPTGGVPVLPEYDQAMQSGYLCPQYAGLAGSYENPPKFRRPQPEYVPLSPYIDSQQIAFSPLWSGGNVSVYIEAHGFRQDTGVCGGVSPSQPEPMVKSPVIDLADNEMDKIITEFLETPVNNSLTLSGDFDAILNSTNDDDAVPTVMPPDTGISTYPESGNVAFPTAVSPARSAGSPEFDYQSDCISPGSAWSSEPPVPSVAMSPGSTVDSGLDEELDTIINFINEDLRQGHMNRSHTKRAWSQSDDGSLMSPYRHRQASGLYATGHYAGQHLIASPFVGSSNPGNPIIGNSQIPNPAPNPAAELAAQNTAVPVISTVVQLVPSGTVSSVMPTTGAVSQGQAQGPVTCIFVSNVAPQPVQSSATSRRTSYCKILPKPPEFPKEDSVSHISARPGLLIFLCSVRYFEVFM